MRIKRRSGSIIAVVVAGAIALTSAVRLAHSGEPAKPTFGTQEECAREFAAYLSRRDMESLRCLVSDKDERALKSDGIVEILKALAYWPDHFTIHKQSAGEKSAVINVAPVYAERPVVCIREGMSWRVDLTKTYALWNGWTEQEADEHIFKTTGAVVPGYHLPEEDLGQLCRTNLKQLSIAMIAYVHDYDLRFPPGSNWSRGLLSYMRDSRILRCPTAEHDGYGFNANMALVPVQSLTQPSDTVMLYDTKALETAHTGTGDDIAFRHSAGANFAYLDGRVFWSKTLPPHAFAPKLNLTGPPP